MPVDPNVSLAAKAPDPLGTLGQFATIQNNINQNRLFQQTFAARTEAGKILASAPDLETGLAALLKNPTTAPFAGETINAIRQSQQALAEIGLKQTEVAGKQQEQSDSGLKGFFRNLGPVMADPSEATWNGVSNATLSTLSPEARKRVGPAIEWVKKGLMNDLPEDPGQRRAAFNQRLSGFLLAGGITPEGINAIAGTPTVMDLGGYKQPGLQRPSTIGGGFAPVGGPLQMTPPAANASGPFGPGGEQQLLQLPGGLPTSGSQGLGQAPPIGGPGGMPGNPLGAGPAVVAQGLSKAQETSVGDQGKNFADYTKHLNERVQGGGQLMTRINEIMPLLEQARTGGGTTWRTRLAEIAQAIGLDEKYIKDIQGGSLPAAQELEKYFVRTAADQMRQSIATGNTSNFELETFLKSNPNLDTDPRASRKIIEYMSKMYRVDKAEQDALAKAQKSSKFDPLEWPNKWQNEAMARGLWKDEVPKAPKGSKTVDREAPKPTGLGEAPMQQARTNPDGSVDIPIKGPNKVYKTSADVQADYKAGKLDLDRAIEALRELGHKFKGEK